MVKKQSTTQTILAALENLTLSVGQLAEKVSTLESAQSPASLENLEITTGKLPDEEDSPPVSKASKLDEVRKLEEVFNTKKVNPYGTTELEIFEEKLKNMTLADMQNIAYKVGVEQHLQAPQLRKALKNSFVQASKSFGGGFRPKPQPVNTRLDPKNAKHLKLMQMMGVATQ
jgi:hypothetical protein